MARLEHRSKTYLKLAVFQFIEKLTAKDLSLTPDFVVTAHLYDRNVMHVQITEPDGNSYHYEIRVIEKT